MTLFLTGSPCCKGEGFFTEKGQFLKNLKDRLPEVASVLLVSAAPDDPDNCKYVFDSTKECFDNSGIRYSSFVMLKRSNADDAAKLVSQADLVMLCGGHVPTQNRFFHEIGLREIMQSYDGVVIGCSAGSMNCADYVYSHPELEGETSDPDYKRWLRGLGLTDINIVPHYEDVHDAYLDGKRLFEDVILRTVVFTGSTRSKMVCISFRRTASLPFMERPGSWKKEDSDR